KHLMVLQVHECGGVAFFTGEEVLINAQYLRTGPARELRDALLHNRLIPALYRRRANAMRARELALRDAAFMGFEDLQPVGYGRAKTWQDAGKAVSKVEIAARAVILRDTQVQHHDLVALAGVFEGAPVRGLDAHALVLAMDAGWTLCGPRPNMNILVALHALYC